MMHRLTSCVPRAAWLALVALAAGCVQLTNFGEDTDTSTSVADEPSSTGVADEGTSDSDETTGPELPEPGTLAWLQLTELGWDYEYEGVERLSDGRVLALGWTRSDPLEPVVALGRTYAADGESFEDLEPIGTGFAYSRMSAACERPDGGIFFLSFLYLEEDPVAMPFLYNKNPAGGPLDIMTYTGGNGQLYPASIANVPRMVCDADGRAWVALSHMSFLHPSVLLARFDAGGFDGYEDLVNDLDGLYDLQVLGLGRDQVGNIHLAIHTGEEPGSGEPLVRWRSYHAEGVLRAEHGLDATELSGPQVVGFAVGGSRVAFITVDPALRTWVVAYDSEGAEQWRSADAPSVAQGWSPGPVGLAEDGSVVVMATVDGHLGLFEVDATGALRWSAEYPFEDDGHPELSDVVLGALDVGPGVIYLVGSAEHEDGHRTGWVRRVLR